MRWVACVAPLALLLVSGNSIARSEVRPLEGTYYFRGATAVDPPPGEPLDSHLLIELTGNAARDLYRRMKVQAKPDQCIGAGAMSKTIGSMQCTMLSNTGYSCHFSIELARQRIQHGLVC
jgi:hypothetical protein